ncbi:hypothetical protein [Phreatobacter stygius]|uniref:Phage tail assembly protein n=1 Tax=Phreatobacter stygius TaxID=1940610 RepID=A0A4D7BGG9_9HYPH|nr:hypothetical protein [Phreatobacter stygius]QCI68848.1 hypothetical protein E8M01_34230 [Phreatobacter stygius]
MPRKTITINLSQSVMTHKGLVSIITLQEPLAGDYFALGDPFTIASSPQGNPFYVEEPERIAAYLDRCVIGDVGPDRVATLGLHDAMAIKEGLLSFFRHGGEAAAGSKTQPTNSSSQTSQPSTPAGSAA